MSTLAARPSVGAAQRVLVVDDEPVNVKLLHAILHKAGYQVHEASGGEQALAAAAQVRPDLVLLDIMMPDLDGYAVCERLKRDPRTAHVPVVFLSALSETKDKLRGFELGAADFMSKPFDRAEVLARVRNLLQLQELTHTLMRKNEELVEKQRTLDEDLVAAAEIQTSLIPSQPPRDERFEACWRFHPCDSIGGDLFNVVRLDEDRYALFIVDVSGHGVPAAMVTVSVAQSLLPGSGVVRDERPARDDAIVPPALVLQRLDRQYPLERFGKFFTISYAVLDARTGQVRYSNAAHPWPLVVRRDGRVEVLASGGTIIGLDGALPFETGGVRLDPGDRLFMYTDGVTEYERADGEPFGDERLLEALVGARGRSLGEACNGVIVALAHWGAGAPAADDVTLLGVEYKGPGGAGG